MKNKILQILNEFAIKYASLNNDVRLLEAKIILEEDFPAIAEKIEALDNWVSERDKARFWSKCNTSNYCWEWSSRLNKSGYGVFRLGKKTIMAHRFAWELINGKSAGDLHVCHHCDNPKCINPDHLFLGTHQDNMIDKVKKGRHRRLGRSSKYFGVSWRDDSKRWRSYYMRNKKTITIGCFETEELAAKAYDDKIIELGLILEYPLNIPSKLKNK